ncbi:MAG: NADH-dependent [FeFe] hydrogenase, group A6 [Eubacteriales bacterium]
MKNKNTLIIDNMEIPIEDERNLLEVIRKAKIDLPTFCYHSEMSIYGACRLCMVDIEGRGLQPSCSTLPQANMVVKTNTAEILTMRKMIVELLLASHVGECPTCSKGANCQLQSLAQRMGVSTVRFSKKKEAKPIDTSSLSILRDPNKCVLCGDCVRMCNEIQQVGAIHFAFRGSETQVAPSFNKNLGEVECVNCGQCARVCPVGALVPKSSKDMVWDALQQKDKHVVVQVAPAVRVAIGEEFGFEPGTISTGKMVAALKRMGFKGVYDTSFTADLTILEEANEFITRYKKGEKIPQFTSCCPGWVKYAEQYYPDYLPNISSCRSPQQMFGSLCKKQLIEQDNIPADDIVMVSVMPCTAKKYEAARDEFAGKYGRDVDIVITTQELALMIKEMGLNFAQLEQGSFDMPYGFKTGGGVIFGNSGGVTEAVIRYAGEELSGKKNDEYEIKAVRGEEGIREASVTIGDITLNFAIVSGLGNAKKVMEDIKAGVADYDFIEVMACPGGCINGGGQPASMDKDVRKKRSAGLYDNDKMLQLHKSQDNPFISEVYEKLLKAPNSHIAHELLHTTYKNRRRIDADDVTLGENHGEDALKVSICFGTSCFVKGSQKILQKITKHMKENKIEDRLEIQATFCYEKCDRGPVVRIGDEIIEKCTPEIAIKEIDKQLK